MSDRGDADAEAFVLSTERGQALLAEASQVRNPRPADLAAWRTRDTIEHVAAAVRLAEARRRGAAKFTRADQMWLEPTGLEQATAEPVARHKARRFEVVRVVDLCCGIGGDTLALAAASDVIAVDRDQGMCRRAKWNATVYEVGEHIVAVRGRAESFGIPPGAGVHLDPDRRANAGARARLMDAYQPGIGFVSGLMRSTAAGAIKVGPASDFQAHFVDSALEIELISFRGECKEATVWYGGLSTCRRRATRLPEGTTWTDRDGPVAAFAASGPLFAWVFDPDPSLLRAGLLDGFAEAHGLTRFVAGIDYLTGPVRVDSPFLSAFEVIAELPLDMKTLRREVASRQIGPLEVKVRGLDRRPEELRAALTPVGDRPATLLLAGGRSSLRGRATGTAVLARRWPFSPYEALPGR